MGNLLLNEKVDEAMIGTQAPDFVLSDNNGREWKLSEHLGQVLTLLFYPQNETLVCTRQLCSVRDHWSEYLKTKATIVGISPGKVDEHQKFSQKYKLPLPLLADEGRQITGSFCQHWLMPLSFTRSIVVIDAKGIIRTKKTMFRGFRPKDSSVIRDIYAARTDALHDQFDRLVMKHRRKN